MTAPAIIQTKKIVATSTATTFTLTFDSSVITGSTIAILFYEPAGVRVFGVTDSQANNYIVSMVNNGTFGLACAVAENVTGGTVTVTFTSSAAANVTDLVMYELDACQLEKWSSFLEGSATTSHFCAPSAGIDIPADSLVLAHGRSANASVTTVVAASGYTIEASATTSAYIQQRKAFTSLTTGERVAYSNTGTARVFAGAMYSFRNIPSGGSSGGFSLVGNGGLVY
jgi:hypothetical protein